VMIISIVSSISWARSPFPFMIFIVIASMRTTGALSSSVTFPRRLSWWWGAASTSLLRGSSVTVPLLSFEINENFLLSFQLLLLLLDQGS
jgi:hypothetical protein